MTNISSSGGQNHWLNNKEATPLNSALKSALVDHQLNRSEYLELKTLFLKDNPQSSTQEFNLFLADLLDGTTDQNVRQKLLSPLQELAKENPAYESILLRLNADSNGYSDLAATSIHSTQLVNAFEQADVDQNGRIENAERVALKNHLEGSSITELSFLNSHLDKELSTLTYSDKDQSITIYFNEPIPRLEAKYKDVKMAMELSLEDIDGITDRSRNDITGTASGHLSFAWDGPLINSLKDSLSGTSSKKSALGQSIQGEVKVNGDYSSRDRAYVIYGEASTTAELNLYFWQPKIKAGVDTRSINIKADSKGRLVIKSPGFGSSVRLHAAKMALEHYAFEDLRKLGYHFTTHIEDDQLILTPRHIQNIPLPLGVDPQSQLEMGSLNIDFERGTTNFYVDSTGMHVNFRELPVNGSSDASEHAAEASPARGEQADKITASFRTGLNVEMAANTVDSQFIFENLTIEADLDQQELQNNPLTQMAKLDGETLKHFGSSTKVKFSSHLGFKFNGVTNQFSVEQFAGKIGFSSSLADAFTHFQKQGSGISLSGTNINYTTEQRQVELEATQGQFKDSKLQLHDVEGDYTFDLEKIKYLQEMIQAGNQQIIDALNNTDINQNQLKRLFTGDDTQLKELLKVEDFVENMKIAVLHFKADLFETDFKSYQAHQANVQGHIRGTGDSGNIVDINVHAKAEELDISHDGEFEMEISGGQAKANLRQIDETEKAQAIIEVIAEDVDGTLSQNQQDLKSNRVSSHIQIREEDGKSINIYSDLKDVTLKRNSEEGSFTLNVKDAQTTALVERAVEDFKTILNLIGAENVESVLKAETQDDLVDALQNLGLNQDESSAALEMLWNPHFRTFFSSEEMVEAVKSSEQLNLMIEVQGEVNVSSQPGKSIVLELKNGEGLALGNLTDAEDNKVLLGNAAATGLETRYDENGLEVEADKGVVRFQGNRPEGDSFALLKADIEQIKASLSGENGTITSGAAEASLTTHTTLDEQKLEEIRRILTEAKDWVVEKLETFGLSKKQIELFVKALGQEQLKKLFESAKKEDLENFLKEIGVSQEQLSQISELLDEEQFKKIVEETFVLTDVLKDSKLDLKASASFESSQIELSEEQDTYRFEQVGSSLGFKTEGEHGNTEFEAKGEVETVAIKSAQDGNTHVVYDDINVTLEGQARPADNETIFHTVGNLDIDRIDRHISQEETRTETQDITGTLSAGFHNPDYSAVLSTRGKIDEISANSDPDNPEDSNLTIEKIEINPNLAVREHSENKSTETDIDAKLTVEEFNSNQQNVTIDNIETRAEFESKNERIGDDGNILATAHATGEASVTIEQIEQDQSTETLTTRNIKGGADVYASGSEELSFNAHGDVEVGEITGHDGEVTIDETNIGVRANMKAPLAQFTGGGELTVEGFRAKDNEASAEVWNIHDINGELRLKTAKLQELFAKSSEASRFLSKLEHHLALRDEDDIIQNQEISILFENMDISPQNPEGNALEEDKSLSGQIRIPSIRTKFGTTHFDMNLKQVTPHADKDSEFEMSGTLTLETNHSEFERQLNKILKPTWSNLGLAKFDPEIKLVEGKPTIKMGNWYFDGVFNLETEGDRLNFKLDKAKLIHILSIRGIINDKIKDGLNSSLFDYYQTDSTFSLSLNDITENFIENDYLSINSFDIDKDNKITLDFSYISTEEYNAKKQERQYQRINERLFHDPFTGNKRNSRDLYRTIDQLNQQTLRRIFEEASSPQTADALKAMGDSSDKIVRRSLVNQSIDKIQKYPLQNRVLMATHLLQGRVTDDDANYIANIIRSLSDEEADTFMQRFRPEELAKMMDEIEELSSRRVSFRPFVNETYNKLKSPLYRFKWTMAVLNGVNENKGLQTLRGLMQQPNPPNFSQVILSISDKSKLEDMVESLSSNELRHIFQTARPDSLRHMLSTVGNDYDDIVRKTLENENNYRRYPVGSRAIMSTNLANNSGFLEGVSRGEKAHIHELIKTLRPQDINEFIDALHSKEYERVKKYLPPQYRR